MDKQVSDLAETILADPERRMDAYYYGFDATGIAEIDAVLSAVASAGKAYHHTDCWNDADCGPSPAEVIQAVANLAASRIAILRASNPVNEGGGGD